MILPGLVAVDAAPTIAGGGNKSLTLGNAGKAVAYPGEQANAASAERSK
jgi:hypothetical protein